MRDLINRQVVIDRINEQREHLEPDVYPQDKIGDAVYRTCAEFIERLPAARTEDYAELKREFNLMAAYIDAILRCSDEQKETLNWFISRLAKHMPWTERDYSD